MRANIRTVDAAQGKWFGILKALGMDENYLRNHHGPCPVCEGKDRFRFDDKDGRGTYYCNNCGAGDGMKLAMDFTGMPFPDLAKRIDQLVGNIEIGTTTEAPKADPTILLNRILREIKPCIGDTPVHRYLASRNLELSPVLKYHPNFAYWEDGKIIAHYPAMVAQVLLADGKPATFHVTFLTPDGKKAPVHAQKKLMPPARPLEGAAVRLFPIAECIGIAEGIETALAARKLFGVPTWAALNSTVMKKFVPPAGVKSVIVFGDNDANYEGQATAFGLARDLIRRGYSAQVKIPQIPESDFADEVAP